jgi:hypothetical protein
MEKVGCGINIPEDYVTKILVVYIFLRFMRLFYIVFS